MRNSKSTTQSEVIALIWLDHQAGFVMREGTFFFVQDIMLSLRNVYFQWGTVEFLTIELAE